MTAEPTRPHNWDVPSSPSPTSRLRPAPEIAHENEPRESKSAYQQLIRDGMAAARHGAVDHITARRISLVLRAKTNDRQLSQGLTRFAADGTITNELEQSLRRYAFRPRHAHHAETWALLVYVTMRGTDRGPLGPDFNSACEQADRPRTTTRPRTPPDRTRGDAAEPHEAAGPRNASRTDGPAYAFVLWAADWDKQRNPEARWNLDDAIRAGKDGDPYGIGKLSVPDWRAGMQALTPEEWADIQAENLADWDPWDEHDWERDYEIE